MRKLYAVESLAFVPYNLQSYINSACAVNPLVLPFMDPMDHGSN